MPHRRPDSQYWWIRVNGKRVSSETADFDAAKAMEQKLNGDAWLDEKMGVKPARSFTELTTQWRKERSTKASFEDDSRIMDWWSDPKRLGATADIRRITRSVVDEIIQRDREVTPNEKSSANNTANHYVAILAAMLNAAVREWSWIESAPKLRTYPAFSGKDEMGMQAAYTVEQWHALQAQLPAHLERPARFALGTGMRKEKVFALEWAQIDMKARRLTHMGTANKLGNTIPLNHTAMSVLEDIRRDPVGTHVRRVFTWQKPKLDGAGDLTYTVEPLGDYGKAWWKALERAELGRYDEQGQWHGELNWHSFRHTFASWLGEAGVPEEIIDRLGGWKGTSKATRKRYTHLNVEYLRPYAAVIDKRLAGEAVQFLVANAR